MTRIHEMASLFDTLLQCQVVADHLMQHAKVAIPNNISFALCPWFPSYWLIDFDMVSGQSSMETTTIIIIIIMKVFYSALSVLKGLLKALHIKVSIIS